MKKIIICMIVALNILIIFSCSYDTTGPHTNNQPIMPLKVGNSWTYNCHYLTGDFVKKAVVTGSTFLENEQKPTRVCVVTWYTFTNDEWVEEEVQYYKNEFRGLYRYYEDKRELVAKYPIELNETWIIPGETEDLGNGISIIISFPTTYECLHKDKEVVTPAGTFNCIEYSETPLLYISPVYSCYSPGIGLITSSSCCSSIELIDYYIK